MTSTPPLARRLPGVRFELPPPPGEVLPRMDIACFVGFAASGPLHVAVAVESLTEFETVFGTGLALARDARTLQPVHALLHPCVRSFFSQGGRRCWVLRVAGEDARTALFPLPGLLLAQREEVGRPWRYRPATLAARSPGSGADGWLVAARIQTVVLRARPLAAAHGVLSLALPASAARGVRLGDLLCVALDNLRVHGRIASVEPLEPGVAGPSMRRVVVRGLATLRAAASDSPGPFLTSLGLAGLDDAGRMLVMNEVDADGEWLAHGRLTARCRLPSLRLPEAGEVVALRFSGIEVAAWMALDEVELIAAVATDGHIEVELTGHPRFAAPDEGRVAVAAWCASGIERGIRLARLDLRVSRGQDTPFVLEELGMGSDAQALGTGTSAFDLPDDEQVFAAAHAGDSSATARRNASGQLVSRFPLASPPLAGELLWLPLVELPDFGPGLGALTSPISRLQRDGLAEFSWTLFAEPVLATFSADALADRAEALRNSGREPRALRGMHALFGGAATALVDEPTLLAVPDAVHPGWSPLPQPEIVWAELPPPAEPPATAADAGFINCDTEPLPAPRFVRGSDPDADGNFTLYWTLTAEDATHELEESADAGFAAATLVHRGPTQRYTVLGKQPGVSFYRVRALLGARVSPWSPTVRVHVGASGYETRPWQPDDLLAIHRLMLRTAAGRGDLLAVLGLPSHFDSDQAAAYAMTLRATRTELDGDATRPPAIGVDELRALSHGALHHPWLVIRRVDEVISFPPDGAVCGQLAASALNRGAWLAVANQPLRDVVALGPPGMSPTLQQRQQLFDAQVNLLRSAPRGFVVGSADTLTPDSPWRPVNVRRLMCLLRRLALRRGATYVFEPNGDTLRRTVERGFETVLDDLFRRGAFAGAQAEAAYRVVTGDELNTPRRRDLGQFWIELKVAPALPMSFLTVRLARSGERLVSREVH